MLKLQAVELSKSYRGRRVVDDVELEIGQGEVVGLLGPNGAGKTTTFYIIVGLARPDSGRVLLNDEEITDLPMYLRARSGISYLPQEPSVFRQLTSEENLLAVLETLPLTPEQQRDRLEELLVQMGLETVRTSKAYTLSGGERRRLEIDLRQAIADRELEVYYQPCLSLRDDTITGCEALVRWRHPQRGMISPAEFIPIAEETGLINQLGEWVLTTACAEAATWPDDIKLAVNVSPVQFRSGTLALKVVAALAVSGLAANRLELEITEAVLIRDDDAALAILHQLRTIGVRIALDDFGTGYSSLSYLRSFPFDKIKVDRAFVSDLSERNEHIVIVQAVVSIARALGMTTTAEGVETEAQHEFLAALGCDEVQGYLFSAPVPLDGIAEFFAGWVPGKTLAA